MSEEWERLFTLDSRQDIPPGATARLSVNPDVDTCQPRSIRMGERTMDAFWILGITAGVEPLLNNLGKPLPGRAFEAMFTTESKVPKFRPIRMDRRMHFSVEVKNTSERPAPFACSIWGVYS